MNTWSLNVALMLVSLFSTGNSTLCYICDSFEGNCVGSVCSGNACVKREAFVDGFLRVQKMCQSLSRPYIEYCEEGVLWKGTKGTECVCQTDYCNSSNALRSFFTTVFTLLLLVIRRL